MVVHAVVNTVEMFAALHVGAPFGFLRVLEMLAFVTLGNAVHGSGGWRPTQNSLPSGSVTWSR